MLVEEDVVGVGGGTLMCRRHSAGVCGAGAVVGETGISGSSEISVAGFARSARDQYHQNRSRPLGRSWRQCRDPHDVVQNSHESGSLWRSNHERVVFPRDAGHAVPGVSYLDYLVGSQQFPRPSLRAWQSRPPS